MANSVSVQKFQALILSAEGVVLFIIIRDVLMKRRGHWTADYIQGCKGTRQWLWPINDDT